MSILDAHNPLLLWLFIISNLTIVLAYYAIPILLFITLRHHRVGFVLGQKTFWLFAAFIGLCGTTQIMEIVVIYRPWFVAQVVVECVTAVISLYAAVVLNQRVYQISHEVVADDSRYYLHMLIERQGLSELKRLKEIIMEQDKHDIPTT